MRDRPIEKNEDAPKAQWWQLFTPITAHCSLATVLFLAAISAINLTTFSGKSADLALFLFGAIALAPICAFINSFGTKSNKCDRQAGVFESLTIWTASLLSLELVLAYVLVHLKGGTLNDWKNTTQAAVWCTLILYCLLLMGSANSRLKQILLFMNQWRSRPIQNYCFALAFGLLIVGLFQIDLTNQYYLPIVRFLFSPPYSDPSTTIGLTLALTFSIVSTAALVGLVLFEDYLAKKQPGRLHRLQLGAAIVSIILVPILFFDFALKSDALHYLAYLGPALQMFNGGAPLVDTYSQYGLAPIVAFWAGLQLGSHNLATANIVVQVVNLTYYAIWFICLYRLNSRKLPSLGWGFLALTMMFGIWAYGDLNLNITPSVMGMRYLPNMVMVLSISLLPYRQRHSACTIFALALSALWSFEAIVGSLGIYFFFVCLANARYRKWTQALADSTFAIFVVAATLSAFVLASYLSYGEFPNFTTYLMFFLSYNPLSDYWTVTTGSEFYGWIPFIIIVFVIFADCWTRILTSRRLTELADSVCFYRYLPMAILLLVQSMYFVSRSIDFTLVIAFLPFFALIFPAMTKAIALLTSDRSFAMGLAIFPISLLIWGLAFSYLALLRQDARHQFWVQECSIHGRCSPKRLLDLVQSKLNSAVSVRNGSVDANGNWLDAENLTRDAILAMHQFASNEKRVTVLLGNVTGEGEGYVSELSLMYSQKWHTWPRSMTFSDNLVPSLARKIVETPVTLESGSLVLVRRNETALGQLEAGILKKVRQMGSLSAIPFDSTNIQAFRFTCAHAAKICTS